MKCQKVIDETRGYLRVLGIDERRLRSKWVSASQGAAFANEILEFGLFLENLEDGFLVQSREIDPSELFLPPVNDLETETPSLTLEQVEYCLECSNCISTCPVSRENPLFSPKLIIKKASLGLKEDIIRGREIWSCLGCKQCNNRCPAMIDIVEFNRSYRHEARKGGCRPIESHHGIMQSLVRFQTRPLRPRRIDWAREIGGFRATGDVFYFVGCLPYFNLAFSHLNISPLDSAVSALVLLNRIGLEPVISPDERCCGHDAWYSGDEETFRQLALWNLEIIKASGAGTVLFSCPEGYATFKYVYPRLFGKLPFEVVHLTDFLARELSQSGLAFRSYGGERITYQDPCRLGRWDGIYDQPRHLLQLVPETELVEMERNRANALCCGTSAWMECSWCSRAIQVERLLEARQTGARRIITACPKCLIHLTCAQSHEEVDIQVKDIYTYLVESLDDG